MLLGFVSGFGLAAYVLLWLVIPLEGETTNIAAKAFRDLHGIALAIALLPALVVVLLVAAAFHAGWISSFAWLLFPAAAGLILVWRNAPGDERDVIRRVAEPLVHLGSVQQTRRALVIRSVVGFGLGGLGLALLLVLHGRSGLRPLAGAGLVTAGFVVVFGPWWLTLARDLVEERQARVRAEERADMAARVHDSVLQTLALIQKNADQPQRVVQLARAQERELRSWLIDGRPLGGDADATVAAAVRRIEREVEAAHGVPMESVIVGDCPLDDDLRELVAAGREAAVNAAKWSGAPVVSLYLEVEPTVVSLFVRDRGVGFDPARVAPDRRGLAESVQGRMMRHGGTAIVRSIPGEGTEVELRLDRHSPRVDPRSTPV